MAGVYVIWAIVDDSIVHVGIVDFAIAAAGVAGVEVGKVDTFVSPRAELEPGGVNALDGVVGDEELVLGAVNKVVEVYGAVGGRDRVHVVGVRAVPDGPVVGGTVVVPADAAGGIGHEVGADVADGIKEDLEIETRGIERVPVAVKYDTNIAGGGMDFDVVVVSLPVG